MLHELLLLLKEMVLLWYLELGILLLLLLFLLLLLESQLLSVLGNGLPDDHTAGSHYTTSTLGKSSAEVFLLSYRLRLLELTELCCGQGFAVCQLN